MVYTVAVTKLATPSERHLNSSSIRIPAYYISVAARNLGERKERWKKEQSGERAYPPIEPWTTPSLDNPETGLIAHVAEDGSIDAYVQCELANGMLATPEGILSAQHNAIRRYSYDLSHEEVFASHPVFNDLHTLRASPSGITVASSGVDAVVELSPDGNNITRTWHATEHGYTTDSFGKPRSIDPTADHRDIFYNTWLRTTHVNSALALPDNSYLVTFFHQGIFGRLTPDGRVTPLVEGLKRPHASRVSGDRYTFVDTGRGIAYRGTLTQDGFTTEHSISIPSTWLQDGQYDGTLWFLVDAEHARVYFGSLQGEILGYDQFDPDWDFFEVLLV